MKLLTRWSNTLMERYLPDPYIFVAILTLVVFGLGLGFTDSGPLDMVVHWGDGFWGLLSFTMQMVIVLVAGYVLAISPVFKKLLSTLAGVAKSPGSAIILVSVVALIACWINWGFGLVIGALFAKEIAKKVPNVDYRLLIASAYSGMIIWHGGLGGSIPLSIATEDHPFADIMGVVHTSETIFSTYNMIIVVALLIAIPMLNRFMIPKPEDTVTVDPKLLEEHIEVEKDTDHTPASKLENSVIISMLIGALGLIYLIQHFITKGFDLNLNIVNFIFLILGVIFHGTPKRFLAAVTTAVKTAGGIIIQFPFYAGIMGMMVASGLAGVMSEWFVSISTESTFPLFTFFAAGLVNFFVPSGGGQWAVQAPIMLDAAQTLGVSYSKTAMAIAWGDAWTNMIQPFWALPALAIAGLRAKDIMGFCIFVLVVSGIIISIGLYFF
ncbi:short-chain fatty acid transporter [Sporosarcina sp. P12(2017)]|uniref:short-chain fatty acid transporter n=1 Tax=unclassified Sporosarcina TaxID=2647733 RepID=UPI000C170600|nr:MULTISPECIES: short-chain fatty acid transporter [unclassified Sporosarcina]PIC56706.1 short-chain fatty acid transporter [Sporosarcina sp. P10]PIC59923.1 short-chain fatty acid transporter [Sporosarcina sp. P12(2017)]